MGTGTNTAAAPAGISVRALGEGRRTMARTAAAMYGSGGVLALLAVALPHFAGVHELGVATGGAIAVGASVFYAIAGGRVPDWALRYGPGFGSLVIAWMAFWAGGRVVSAAFAMFYVWVALYVAYFQSRRALVANLAVAHLSHGIVLITAGTDSAPVTIWLFALVTSVVVGVMVTSLVGRLRSTAAVDGLTGVPNRRSWDQALEVEVRRAGRDRRPLSVAMIDLDRFKQINDRFGHEIGDVLLTRLSRVWDEALRATDVLGRIGGDEFAVVLPASDADDARAVLERLRAASPAGASSSVGIATWIAGEGAGDLVRRADEALYEAKRRGRDRVVVADARLEPSAAG